MHTGGAVDRTRAVVDLTDQHAEPRILRAATIVDAADTDASAEQARHGRHGDFARSGTGPGRRGGRASPPDRPNVGGAETVDRLVKVTSAWASVRAPSVPSECWPTNPTTTRRKRTRSGLAPRLPQPILEGDESSSQRLEAQSRHKRSRRRSPSHADRRRSQLKKAVVCGDYRGAVFSVRASARQRSLGCGAGVLAARGFSSSSTRGPAVRVSQHRRWYGRSVDLGSSLPWIR